MLRSGLPGTVLGLFLLLLGAGCGWKPLYNQGRAVLPSGQDSHPMGLVDVAFIPGRDGQILRGCLDEELHAFRARQAQTPARWILHVAFAATSQAVAYNAQATVTRTEEEGTVTLTLKDKATGALVLTDTLTEGYAFAVSAANPHTRSLSFDRRAMLEALARQIVVRVARGLAAKPAAGA
jgi:hypothetical protein